VGTDDRVAALRKMMAANPDDPRPRLGLAMEHEKAGRWTDVVGTLRDYLARVDDEGNAWGRLGHALRELGHDDEARGAYERGIAAAERHRHPTMADEFREVLEDW
jgi:Flp pilus assembly protein TadD